MLPETRKMLEHFYRPHNEHLSDLLGETFNYNKDTMLKDPDVVTFSDPLNKEDLRNTEVIVEIKSNRTTDVP